ncbi:MAG: hypothetical protein ABI156_12000 [Caldimonas sp.]
MSSYKQTAWRPAGRRDPATETLRLALAAALRDASALLAQLAYRLARRPARTHRATPQLEFYAEAGAPEGALYVDGRLVGYVPGVRRL